VGCYLDNAARNLKHGPKKAGYDPTTCATKCAEGNYIYTALQDGGICYCDNKYGGGEYVKKPDAECNAKGVGKGGTNRNAIYTHDEKPFTAELSAKNGVPDRTYHFQVITDSKGTGTFTDIYIAACAKRGMMPVCDHPSYCDSGSIYIGQTHHLHIRVI
jgi:hypothetical protein